MLKLFAEGQPAHSILQKNYGLSEILDVLPFGEFSNMEKLEVTTLTKRLDVCMDPSARHNLVASELSPEADFKHSLEQWEKYLQKAWTEMNKSCKAELCVSAYPQTVKMAEELKQKEKQFEDEWEALIQAHSYQAKISQQRLDSLNEEQQGYKLRLKGAKDEEKKGEVGKGGRSTKRLQAASERDFQNSITSLMNGESGAVDEADEERSKLTIQIQDCSQKQFEQCLVFRVFAAKICLEKQQIIRRYRTLLQMSDRRKQAVMDVLCGDDSKATDKLLLIVGGMVMEKLNRECLTWQVSREDQASLRETKNGLLGIYL